MRKALMTSILAVGVALLPLAAAAQTPIVLPHGAGVRVAWDAPPVDATGANAPTGYRFETFRETTSGVVITTVDVPATQTEAELPSTVLPEDGGWLLAVRAFNNAGVSPRSNALPFVRPEAPGAPVSLRVVQAP